MTLIGNTRNGGGGGHPNDKTAILKKFPGKTGHPPPAPTIPFDATWGCSWVLSPAPAGRHTIAQGSAVGVPPT
jgi:hypothetical protein